MITKDQAVKLQSGTLYHETLKKADGNPKECRINGMCKTWKKTPEAFRLPVKHGLRDYFYITEDNAHQWSLTPPLPNRAKSPKDYEAIKLWGILLGSFDYYIQNEQKKAFKDNAPLDAICEEHSYTRKGPGIWRTVDGLQKGHPFRNTYRARMEAKNQSDK